MDIHELRKNLIDLCKSFKHEWNSSIIVETPYIPYIPENWNGYLVLAEAQNLNYGAYADYTDAQKICRLYPDQDSLKCYTVNDSFPKLDIYPWDDGSIPLALKAALDLNPYETAVCNACFWSQRKGGANDNPNEEMRQQSIELWKAMWSILDSNVKHVITCGSIAASIFDFAKEKRMKLRLPSKTAMSRVSGMFKKEDLLMRYPEVKKAYDELFNDNEVPFALNKIFFACHAVSSLKSMPVQSPF